MDLRVCPNCGDQPIPVLAKEKDGLLFCGVCCIREYLKKKREEEINTTPCTS
jgi:ribosomal protein S27AE